MADVAPTAQEWASHAGLCHTFPVNYETMPLLCALLPDSGRIVTHSNL